MPKCSLLQRMERLRSNGDTQPPPKMRHACHMWQSGVSHRGRKTDYVTIGDCVPSAAGGGGGAGTYAKSCQQSGSARASGDGGSNVHLILYSRPSCAVCQFPRLLLQPGEQRNLSLSCALLLKSN